MVRAGGPKGPRPGRELFQQKKIPDHKVRFRALQRETWSGKFSEKIRREGGFGFEGSQVELFVVQYFAIIAILGLACVRYY